MRLIVCLLSLLFALPTAAKEYQVTIDAWTDKTDTVAIGEQVILTIELRTDRWFNGGTRISLPTIPQAMVLQRNPMAINAAENVEGVAWAVQKWEIVIYPQQSGRFEIPEVRVEVQVAGGGSSREGFKHYLRTPKRYFMVELPSPHLTKSTAWVPAPELEFQQTWSVNESDELKVGDAVVRHISIYGKNTSAMMFPEVKAKAIDQATLYKAPSKLSDSQNRGQYEAQRSEQWTYIVQQAGVIEFPIVELKWWNTQTNELETLVLEGKVWKTKHTFQSFVKEWRLLVIVAVLTLVALIALAVYAVRYYRFHPLPDSILFASALSRKNTLLALHLLYRRLRKKQHKTQLRVALENYVPLQSYTPFENSESGLADLDAIAEHSFTANAANAAYGDKDRIEIETDRFKQLWRLISKGGGGCGFKLPAAIPQLEKERQPKKN